MERHPMLCNGSLIVTLTTPPTAIHRFHAISIKISMALFFVDLEKPIIKFHTASQRILPSHNNPEKNKSAGLTTLSNFKTHYKYKVTVIKTVWCWNKVRHIDR